MAFPWSRRVCGRRTRRLLRGQALLEFAIFFQVLLFLTIGVIDIGGLLDDHVSIEYAARQGARTGAVLGNAAPAATPYSTDCAIIGAAQAALVGVPNVSLQWIHIYDAGPDGSFVAGSPIPQDLYAGNSQCGISGGLPTITPAPNPANLNWAPSARNSAAFSEDSLGVQLDYSYTFQFPLVFTGTFLSSDRAIMPLNPAVIPSNIPTPTPPPAPTATLGPTPTPTPTATPCPGGVCPTPTPTPTPAPTATPVPTATPCVTCPTPTPAPTPTPTQIPTPTPTLTPLPTPDPGGG